MITLNNPNRRKEPLTENEEESTLFSINDIMNNRLDVYKYGHANRDRVKSNIQAFVDQYADMKEKLKAIKLLRDLADLQNGPPLETYLEEWEKTMKEVYDFLGKYE